ncbi:MAG TPA: ABC transporter permease [Clostridia bacterium]|nr:ABC transporter permease [Clostridia bacterium]
MEYFLKVLRAEMRKQHKNRFFGKSIYVSLFLWPLLTFITAYYSYKPFPLDKIVRGLDYINESNLIIFVLMGYMCLIFFRCFVQSAWLFSSERTYGTLELIYMTPANRLAFIMGNAVASLFESIWLFVVFAAGIFILNASSFKINIGCAILGIILLLTLSILWGMLLNALFLFSRDSAFLFTVLEEPMEIFAGIKVPAVIFPLWAKVISAVFPLTYIAEMLRRIFIKGDGLLQIRGFVLISILTGLVMLTVTIICLRLGEEYARKTGNMALF